MPLTKEIVCPSCKGTFSVEEGVLEGFCLRCGAPFRLEAGDGTPPEGSDCAVRANRVKELYASYRAEMEELSKKKPRTLIESLLGRDSFGTDPMHAKYRELISGAVDALAGAAEQGGGQENHCAEIISLILAEKDPNSAMFYWPLLALEMQAAKLFGAAPADRLVAIHEEYCRVNPRNRSLPNQLEVRKLLEAEIRAKGAEPVKTGLFGGVRKEKH